MVNSIAEKILKTLELIAQRQMSKWTNSVGNSLVIEYYTGVEAGNPSGTTTNIKFLRYNDKKDKTILRKELQYNGADLIIKEDSKIG